MKKNIQTKRKTNQANEKVPKNGGNEISFTKNIRNAEKNLYLEYLEELDLLDQGINIDKMLQRLNREKYALINQKNNIKSEIVVKRTIQARLKKSSKLEDKRNCLQLEKELAILNVNCDLCGYAISLKRKAIIVCNKRKSCTHQQFKRMRTWERHYAENTALVVEEY